MIGTSVSCGMMSSGLTYMQLKSSKDWLWGSGDREKYLKLEENFKDTDPESSMNPKQRKHKRNQGT